MAEVLDQYALITLEDAKMYLRIGSSDSTYNDIITILINSVSQAIEKFIGRNIIERQYEEVYSGTGVVSINLRQYPVSAISGVWMDATSKFETDSLLDPDTYYCNRESGILYRVGGVFDKGANNIKVEYTAGYETVPADLRLITMVLVRIYFERWQKGSEDVNSLVWQSQNLNYLTDERFPLIIREVFNKYRLWGRNG